MTYDERIDELTGQIEYLSRCFTYGLLLMMEYFFVAVWCSLYWTHTMMAMYGFMSTLYLMFGIIAVPTVLVTIIALKHDSAVRKKRVMVNGKQMSFSY